MTQGPRPMLTFDIPGRPHGKGRPRFSRNSGRPYTPKATENAENWVKSCAINAWEDRPVTESPLRVGIAVGSPIAASWPKAKKAAALDGSLRATGKPDLDNVAKLICDALNGIVWRDDSQITELFVSKAYMTDPFTRVTITEL